MTGTKRALLITAGVLGLSAAIAIPLIVAARKPKLCSVAGTVGTLEAGVVLPVADATVTYTRTDITPQRGYTTYTGPAGVYGLEVPLGMYGLEVSAAGYQTKSYTNILLNKPTYFFPVVLVPSEEVV